MVRVTYPKNPEPSLPQNTNYLVLLFQQPHLWNTRHQQFLKVRVFYDAPAEMIVGLANLPRNGDEEFESLATQFTLPWKEDLSIFQWRDPIFESNPFTRVFEHLGEMIEMADLTEPATDVEIKNRSKYRAHNNKYHRLSQHSVRDFIDAVGSSIHLSTEFHTPSEDIKFHVPSCKVKGTLRCEGSIARRSDTRARITLPLVTFAAIHPHKPKGCITNEIPHILVQAIIAFQRNPDLNKFRGHMIRQEGVYFDISSALVSRAYIQSVQLGRVPTEDISLFRSETYDLREQEGRREALRTLIGMMRYLDEAWFDG